jgi:hypothetical protein
MADRKISDLTALTTPASGDYLPIVDISESAAASKNKRITIEELMRGAPNGTAAAPSIAFESDPNSGLFSPGADQVAISTNGTERARLDSSGRLLVGTTASGALVNISANTTEDALRITQTGTGNALVVEDSANPDASPFVIDQFGRLVLAHTTALALNGTGGTPLQQLNAATSSFFSAACYSAVNWGNTLASPGIFLAKARADAVGTYTIVPNNQSLGQIRFAGADGVDFQLAALISAEVDGTPSAGDMPGRLVFSTTADGSNSVTERMRLNNEGELLVGYTADNGAYKLQVNSQIFATSATVATSDGRYKENVATLNGCIDLVSALRPVSFDWKPQQDITRIDEDGNSVLVREGHNFPDGKQVGFIAQEVQEVLADKPWLGSVIKQNVRPAIEDADGNELAPEDEFFGIAEGNLTAVLTAALQEAIAKINALETRIAALELD